jgi:SAM-dependent methyltransferase
MWCVEHFYPNWRELMIHECSPVERGASVKLARQGKQYLGTQFFRDFPRGQTHPSGYRCEDLEKQTFADQTFDLVISQDVLEHVLDPAHAFREIARTLKDGGAHIFTTPLVNKNSASQVRARMDDSGIVVHLFPPEYHSNPVDAKGSLVTIHWGYDIADFILRWSGLLTTLVYIDDLSRGIRAEYIEVLVSRKLSVQSLSADATNGR